jgi:ankyrin repeat protein
MSNNNLRNFIDFHPRDDKGLTSLHQAAAQGQLKICLWMIYSLVLNNVIEINPRNHEGTTPLHLPVMNGQIELWKFMAVIVDETNTEGVAI